MPLSRLIQPAIKLASKGIVVNQALADDLKVYGKEVLINHPNSKAIFYKADGQPYARGETLVQRNLAHSLTLIASQDRTLSTRALSPRRLTRKWRRTAA